MLNNLKNYHEFADFAKTGQMVLFTKDININTWQDYYDGLLNIMKDGIETDFVQKSFITVDLGDNDVIDLSVFDLYFNLIHWYFVVRSGREITGRYLFFHPAITQDTIKDFIDDNFIEEVKKEMDIVLMNNIIDDDLHSYIDVDNFSMYLANTICLEDDIAMMDASEEFDDLLHTSFGKDTQIDKVKDLGMDRQRRYKELVINDSKKLIGRYHCFRNAFLSQEGINDRQHKEYEIHIGSKPNGQGGVHPAIIDSSYIQGALNTVQNQFIDSSASRVAQIQMKNNMGYSGNFARILGLNNIDSSLYPDSEYDCHTNNYQIVEIKNEKILNLLLDRYYRSNPQGIEKRIHKGDTFLIGQKIYLRSPMTCASAARGHGVCYKCYGDLAYTNTNIKIGKYAAEKLSSELSQRQLSAKHLLETNIIDVNWRQAFYDYFGLNINVVQMTEDYEFQKNTYLLIDPEDIKYENEDDYKRTNYVLDDDDDDDEEEFIDSNYNKYIKKFYLEDKDGNIIEICTDEEDEDNRENMYISSDLDAYIRRKGKSSKDGLIQLDLLDLSRKEIGLFLIKMQNNELSKTLSDIQNALNKKVDAKDLKKDPEKYSRHGILQHLFELVIEGKLHIMGVHLEVLLMNQLRSATSVLDNPDWDNPNEPYQFIRLDQALKDNPSVTVSLLYQNLSKTLFYPLSFRKTKPSVMDLFFMKQPQNFLSDTTNIVDDNPKQEKICIAVRHRVHKDK